MGQYKQRYRKDEEAPQYVRYDHYLSSVQSVDPGSRNRADDKYRNDGKRYELCECDLGAGITLIDKRDERHLVQPVPEVGYKLSQPEEEEISICKHIAKTGQLLLR